MLLAARPIRTAPENATELERGMSTRRPGQTPGHGRPTPTAFGLMPRSLAADPRLAHLPGGAQAVRQLAEGRLPGGVAGGVVQVGSFDHHLRVAVEGSRVLHEVEELVETLVLLEEPPREHEVAGRHGALVGAVYLALGPYLRPRDRVRVVEELDHPVDEIVSASDLVIRPGHLVFRRRIPGQAGSERICDQ